MRSMSKFVDTDEARMSTCCTTGTTAVVLDGLQSGTKEEASSVTVGSSASGLWGDTVSLGESKKPSLGDSLPACDTRGRWE